MNKQAFTVTELSERWGVDARTIRGAINEQRIQVMDCFTKPILISKDVVEEIERKGVSKESLNIFEKNRLEKEIEKLKARNLELENRLKRVVNIVLEGV